MQCAEWTALREALSQAIGIMLPLTRREFCGLFAFGLAWRATFVHSSKGPEQSHNTFCQAQLLPVDTSAARNVVRDTRILVSRWSAALCVALCRGISREFALTFGFETNFCGLLCCFAEDLLQCSISAPIRHDRHPAALTCSTGLYNMPRRLRSIVSEQTLLANLLTNAPYKHTN